MIKRRLQVFGIATALALGFDQASKVWARLVLRPIYPQVKTVINGYWDFRYSENRGAAFGILHDVPSAHLFFAISALVITIGAVVFLWKARPRHPLRLAVEVGLIVGGALGNAVDRLIYGRVTDFVVWKIGQHEWHTFNVADAALVVGVIGLFLDSGRSRPDGAKAASAT